MNQVPRFDSLLRENVVRHHYEGVAFGAAKVVWRRRLLILSMMAAGLLGGLVALALLPRTYTADAIVQLDFGRDEQGRGTSSFQSTGPTLDAAAIVESEARLLRSRAIARRVVEHLNLAENPAFTPVIPTFTRLMTWLSTKTPEAEISENGETSIAQARALRGDLVALDLLRNLTVTNDTRAYLITVAYTSPDAARSAIIANAFTDEYLRNRMEAGLATAQRTSEWIGVQIQGTRAALESAEAGVNAYRRQSGFLEVGAEGTDLRQQQLQDLTARLDAATANRLAEEGRLSRSREVFAAGNVPSAQDLAGAPLIQRLLEARETAQRDFSDLSRNGPKHPGLARARATLDETQARLRTEVDRAIANLEGDAKTAAEAESALATRIQQIKDAVIDSKKRESQLRSLQRDASSLRDRLKLLTDSHAQAIAAAGLKSASAQVVMQAEAPPVPTGPNPVFVLGLALFGSAGAGLGLSFLIESRKTGFTSDLDLAAETQLACLGMLPVRNARPRLGETRMSDEAVGLIGAGIEARGMTAVSRVVLVTSSVPGEGKTEFIDALAAAAGKKGRRTLIIDASSGRTSKDPNVSASRSRCLADILAGGEPAAFLAGIAAEPVVRVSAPTGVTAAELDAEGRLTALVAAARTTHDLVLLECPPVLLALDVVPLARCADTVVHVVGWNRTPRRTVMAALHRLDTLSITPSGTVLTRVDMHAHRQYFLADQCSHYAAYRQYFAREESAAVRTTPLAATDATGPSPERNKVVPLRPVEEDHSVPARSLRTASTAQS
ncbi:GumC family protein [Methylobacterium marchantiae]|uniref:GumC family protein n=1 Tax=Methylobacterium marchantiae TaxID=600331 RepID=A0ABW3X558_9HYPH|nr:hypothetical protein AIGOOFII_3171 [Methylobacterium marchantiae]